MAEQSNPIWVLAALAGVFLTSYYTFRLLFIILRPSAIDAHEDEHPNHKAAYACMTLPLIVLAAVVLSLGFGLDAITRFLGRTGIAQGTEQGHHMAVLVISLSLDAAALALAWYEFGRRGASQIGIVERMPTLAAFFDQRWYLDHFYRFALDNFIYRGIAALCHFNDREVIDGGLDGLSRGTIASGGLLSRLHVSMIQNRLIIIFGVMALIGIYLVTG